MKTKEPKNKKRKETLYDYPSHLRGETNTHMNGYKNIYLRPYAGGKYGAASECHTFSAEECVEWAQRNGFE